MGSSGQQPVTQQTTQTRDPWINAQPFLTQIMGTGAGYFNSNTGGVPYPGNTTAPLQNQYTTPAYGAINTLAGGELSGSANVNAARGYLGDLVTNQGLSPQLSSMAGTLAGQSNPYLQDVLNQQMNKVNSAMSGAGRYGSGSHDAAIAQAIAPTLAQDYMQRQGMAADIYGQGMQRAGQAAQLIPSLDEARYAGAGHLLDIGQQQRAYDQALLDQQMKLYNAQQMAPWEQLFRYSAAVGGAGGLGGTQITSSPGATQPSTLQRVLGGGLAGAGLGSAIFPGVGTGIGAAAGGLMGLL
jgi:hypothetical protein